MSQNRDLASPNDRELNFMPKAPIESFWDALWLGIQPFLCFRTVTFEDGEMGA